MKGFPQLRVRTGYTHRDVYGRLPEVFDRLAELEAPIAAVVDRGTWCHVRWEKEAKKRGLPTIYGMEVPIKQFDEEGQLKKERLIAWILADNLKSFYNATSRVLQSEGLTPEEYGQLTGVVRFSGAALSVLEDHQFDFIDINPSSVVYGYEGIKRFRNGGLPIVLTAYNSMPKKEHEPFAYAWEVGDSVGQRTLETPEAMWDGGLNFFMSEEEFKLAIRTTEELAEKLAGQVLPKAPLIHLEGDMVALAREGQKYRLAAGHIKEWTQEYEDRFIEEIKQIQLKEFDSYFLVVADLIAYAKDHMLVGPARGSSAGSLICYVLRITEVDPIPHKLLFARFIDISRADFPDIDIDFADTKRHLVFEYLQNKYGAPNVVKLGNINTLKANSVIAQVGKKFNIHISETDNIKNAIIEYSSADERYGKGLEDTLSKTAPGIAFRDKYPEAAMCMGDIEIHPSHYGVHAAGILVCNDPITDYCTVNAEGVAQLDKPDSEYLNLLKIDALGLRTLGVIEDAGVITADELYSLELNDQSVLDILNEDRVSGIFQFEGDAVRSVTRFTDVTRFETIDHLTALARPGPLSSGMAQRYIERAAGREPVVYEVPQLEPYLRDTFGVFLYQEQIMWIVKDLGDFSWEQTSAIRKAMSGRKGKEFFSKMEDDFVRGAANHGISESDARKIFGDMCTFGAWGFNRSHSVSYAIVTYWTCYLKRYHKLEFAAACLRSAKDDQQTIAILRELDAEGITYTAIDPDHSELNWAVANGQLLGGILNAKGFGLVTADRYIEARRAGTLTAKQREKLANAEVNFSDLHEAHTKFGKYYDDPSLIGVTSGNPIVGMRDVKDKANCLVIAKLTKKVVSDMNEPVRVKKRNGKLVKGQSLFIDLMMVDDSTDGAMRFRVRHDNYEKMGKPIAEGAPKNSWFLIRAWKISGIDMFIINNIKRIKTDREIELEAIADAKKVKADAKQQMEVAAREEEQNGNS